MSLKIFFFPFSMIIVVVLVIWFIIPQWEEMQKQRVILGKKNDTMIVLEEKKNDINKNIEIYAENAREASVIYDALPSDVNNDVLIDEIFDGAKSKGVLVTSLNVGKIENVKKEVVRNNLLIDGDETLDDENGSASLIKQDVLRVPISLELIGNYTETKDYIKLLESATRLFTVTNVEMGQSDGEGSFVNTSVSAFCLYKNDNQNLEISSVIYNEDSVLKELMEKGLDFNYISQYKNSLNSNYIFSPATIVSGKSDLFAKTGSDEITTVATSAVGL